MRALPARAGWGLTSRYAHFANSDTLAALQRNAWRRAEREAASIAGPDPAYPATAPLHGDWLGGCINGHTVIIRLMRDPAHRSDQWSAEVDGVAVADAAGLTRLHDLLRARWPKAQSKRMLCAAQDGYSARDEADAAAC